MKPLILANWKMNPTSLAEAKRLFNSVKAGIKGVKAAEVVVCPPFCYLLGLSPSSNLKLGAQNCFWEEKGAFTGEISPLMLKGLGLQYVLIGHSERRRNVGEIDEMVNKKLKAVLAVGLKPILCIGSKTREFKKETKDMKAQLEGALFGISKPDLKKILVTYEPVWAISTTRGGVVATPADAKRGANFIKITLAKLFDKATANKVRLLYGGSVDSTNIQGFIEKSQMDGVLVGGASLKSGEFIKLVKTLI